MKILLTGASSYVGARIFFDLSKKFEVLGTYNSNQLSDKFVHLDTTNPAKIKELINEYKPEIIIHAAANANARWCEANSQLATAINELSTKYIVESANSIGAKVFLISSFAASDPSNVYGKTKYHSEKFVKQTNAGYLIIRPSLIVGFSPNTTNDRPFNRLLKNLDKNSDAIYDTSWKFQPTYVGHISEIIIQAIKNNIVNETIPVTVPELKTRYDLARDILTPFGVNVMPIDSQDFTTVTTDNLQKLTELQLPVYSYSNIIEKIIWEIKNRSIFAAI